MFIPFLTISISPFRSFIFSERDAFFFFFLSFFTFSTVDVFAASTNPDFGFPLTPFESKEACDEQRGNWDMFFPIVVYIHEDNNTWKLQGIIIYRRSNSISKWTQHVQWPAQAFSEAELQESVYFWRRRPLQSRKWSIRPPSFWRGLSTIDCHP